MACIVRCISCWKLYAPKWLCTLWLCEIVHFMLAIKSTNGFNVHGQMSSLSGRSSIVQFIIILMLLRWRRKKKQAFDSIHPGPKLNSFYQFNHSSLSLFLPVFSLSHSRVQKHFATRRCNGLRQIWSESQMSFSSSTINSAKCRWISVLHSHTKIGWYAPWCWREIARFSMQKSS